MTWTIKLKDNYEALDENNKRENGMLIKLILKRKHKSKFILGCKKYLDLRSCTDLL